MVVFKPVTGSFPRCDSAKRGLRCDSTVRHFVFMGVSICLSHVYGQAPLLIFVNFGINVIGAKVERCMRKHFSCTSRFKIAVILWVFFAVTGVESTFNRSTSYSGIRNRTLYIQYNSSEPRFMPHIFKSLDPPPSLNTFLRRIYL